MGGGDFVARQRQLRACTHREVSDGGYGPPKKLENSVFLQLKLCNLVNTFRRKLKGFDG